ncbi:MAG: hypothetical protein IPK69_12545 [Phycisphaerales bacterium]|nr:MAG: hypothetical protein IPK69_12545 [Phycisphaerales bacterium]
MEGIAGDVPSRVDLMHEARSPMPSCPAVYRSLMADTPENTAASMNERPATPRKGSLWRRVRRATRVVAAVVLGVVCALALVAWPVSYVRGGALQVKRSDINPSVRGMVIATDIDSTFPMDPKCVCWFSVDLKMMRGKAVVDLWSLDSDRGQAFDAGASADEVHPFPSTWEVQARRINPRTRPLWSDTHTISDIPLRFRGLGVSVFSFPDAKPGFLAALIAVPLWMIAVVAGIPAYFLSRGVFRRRRGPDECVTCGYSRVGLPSGAACPECGAGGGTDIKTNAEDAEGRGRG